MYYRKRCKAEKNTYQRVAETIGISFSFIISIHDIDNFFMYKLKIKKNVFGIISEIKKYVRQYYPSAGQKIYNYLQYKVKQFKKKLEIETNLKKKSVPSHCL